MKLTVIKYITLLVIISFLGFKVGAEGLQNYLQNTKNTTEVVSQIPLVTEKALTTNTSIPSDQLTNIIEMIVAGIVASALILSLLVLFFGRWVANREKKVVKKIRVEMEQEKEHIISASSTIKEQEKETTLLVHNMRIEAKDLSKQSLTIEKQVNNVIETTEQVEARGRQIEQVTQKVSNKFDEIQGYWETQLSDTVSTIKGLHNNLDQSLEKVDDDIDKMHHQKLLSQELLQDFLDRHNEQSELISQNSEVSEEVSKNLDETLKESKQLVELLKHHQDSAEKSLKKFTDELVTYEEQAYEQFDTSFQVADLARQELSANVDESRKHIETMRRHEEKSHAINTQTQKNLESLDYSKIVKLSNTIDSAQDMFTDMRSKVEETKMMLDELKDIETDVRKTANNVESSLVISNTLSDDIFEDESKDKSLLDDEHLQKNMDIDNTEYKMVSGDSTPISFFKNIKKNNNN